MGRQSSRIKGKLRIAPMRAGQYAHPGQANPLLVATETLLLGVHSRSRAATIIKK